MPGIAACQFEPVVGDVDANVAAMADRLATLDDGVAVAVFPELCVTGYALDVADGLASSVPGALTEPLVRLAGEHDIDVVAGVPERDGADLYNDLVYVDRDGVRARYRKQYLWGDEADAFVAGDETVTVDSSVGRVGFALCYDLNFPEVGLEYAAADCDVLAVSAAWRTPYLSDWRLLARARGLDGPGYVVGSNHVGTQRGREHGGHSLVAGPNGEVLGEAEDEPGHAVTSVDGDRLAAARDRNPVRDTREDW